LIHFSRSPIIKQVLPIIKKHVLFFIKNDGHNHRTILNKPLPKIMKHQQKFITSIINHRKITTNIITQKKIKSSKKHQHLVKKISIIKNTSKGHQKNLLMNVY